MADIVGSLTTELRITGRIFRETAMGLKRTGWMNWIIIVTMASILSIFGVVMALVLEVGVFLHNVGSELEISVYSKDDTNIDMLKDQLVQLPHLRKVTIVPKDKAWQDMQKDYALPDIENPLPDTIHLQMTSQSFIPETVEKVKIMPGVEAVQYAKKVLDKIQGITRGALIVGMAVSLFLGTLTLFIINNTIHLLIQAKSREIEILRMMGVGNWYIQLPFLIQGAVYGLAGAIIAFLLVSIAEFYIVQFFSYMGFQTNDTTSAFVLILLILMGILVGSGGAAVAVRRYIHI